MSDTHDNIVALDAWRTEHERDPLDYADALVVLDGQLGFFDPVCNGCRQVIECCECEPEPEIERGRRIFRRSYGRRT